MRSSHDSDKHAGLDDSHDLTVVYGDFATDYYVFDCDLVRILDDFYDHFQYVESRLDLARQAATLR